MGKLHPYPPRQFTRQPTLTGGPKETLAPPPSRCPAVALSPPAPAQCSRHKPSPLLLAPKSRPPPPVRRPNGAVHVGLLLLPQRGHLRHLRHLPHRSAVPGEEASAPGRGQGAACGLRVLRGDRRREGARRGGRDLRVVVPRLQPSLPRAARRRGRGDRVLLRPRGADSVGARGGGAQWSLPLRRVLPHPPCSTPPHLTTTPPPSPPPLAQANLRILVTSGAGFIGSHLIDKLMENEKHEVIVADNFFTGSKDNLKKWIGHPRFELIRHDVTQPLLVEVDQIYHLACPASPIFYKHNPVKGMRFVDLDDEECYERFRRRERRGLVARDYTEVYASMPGSYGRAVVEPYSCELRLVLCGIVLVI